MAFPAAAVYSSGRSSDAFADIRRAAVLRFQTAALPWLQMRAKRWMSFRHRAPQWQPPNALGDSVGRSSHFFFLEWSPPTTILCRLEAPAARSPLVFSGGGARTWR